MRIFVFGKVYDLDNQPIVDIEKDIETRVLDFTKVDIAVKININSPKSYEIVFHRGINVSPGNGNTILEQDTWLISGEGYNGFTPVYRMACNHFPNMLYYIDLQAFCHNYKNNAEHYGADKVKKVRVEELPLSLTLELYY